MQKRVSGITSKKTLAGLENYVKSLSELYGEDLISIILYGSAARDDYVAGVSNINILVVLEDAQIKEIKKARDISRQARNKFSIEPRFMSLETITIASDVLPIAFLDMQEQYSVLHGQDVLREITIERRYLKYQCESRLRFILMRMRNFYLFFSRDQKIMSARLVESFTYFLHLLKSIYRLQGDEPPIRQEEIVTRSAKRFNLDGNLMGKILDLKRKQRRFSREEVETLFEGYIDLIYDTIQLVDKISED